MLLVTDIDDVIADASWRKELLPNWDEYHAASIQDPPHQHIIDLINMLYDSGAAIVALTGRPEKWRHITNSWLLAHDVSIEKVWMRPADDFMTSPQFKLAKLKGADIQPDLILEDRDDVVVALRGAGYNVLQVFNQRVKP